MEDTVVESGIEVTEQGNESAGNDVATGGSPGSALPTDTSAEELFYDATTVPPELSGTYKQMQAAFTKKTQALAEGRQKVKAYDEFARDPIGTMQRIAAQYGYNLSQGQQKAEQAPSEFQPNSWDDVFARAKQEAISEMRQQLAPQLTPLYEEYRSVKKSLTEKMLDENVPDWRQYEDEMTEVLQKHPTLYNDPVKLAELAMPKEVRESRAMQAALKKMEAKAKSSAVSGASTTKASTESGAPSRPTFQQAVELARRKLRG